MGEDSIQIYRSFDFGELLSLHLLDTRLIARDQQLAYKNYLDGNSGAFAAEQFQADISGDRQLLGKVQLAWLTEQLSQSKAKWQLLGQQVLMAKMHIPAELLLSLIIGSAESYARAWLSGRVKHSPNHYAALLAQAAWASISQTPAQSADI